MDQVTVERLDVTKGLGIHCDFCPGQLPPEGMIPAFTNLMGVSHYGPTLYIFKAARHDVRGPWGMCRRCSRILKITESTTEVPLNVVQKHYIKCVNFMMRDKPGWERLMYTELRIDDTPEEEGVFVRNGVTRGSEGQYFLDIKVLLAEFNLPSNPEGIAEATHRVNLELDRREV